MSLQDNLTNAIHQGLWAYTRGKNYRQQQYNEQQEFDIERALTRATNTGNLAKDYFGKGDLEHGVQMNDDMISSAKDAKNALLNLPVGYIKPKGNIAKGISALEKLTEDVGRAYGPGGEELEVPKSLPKGQPKVPPQTLQEEALGRAPEAIYARDMVNKMKQPGLPQLAYDPTAGLQREDLIPAHPNGQKLLDWNGVPSGKSIEEFANNGISQPIQQAANTQAQATIQQHEIQKQAMKEHMAVIEGKMKPTYQEEQQQYTQAMQDYDKRFMQLAEISRHMSMPADEERNEIHSAEKDWYSRYKEYKKGTDAFGYTDAMWNRTKEIENTEDWYKDYNLVKEHRELEANRYQAVMQMRDYNGEYPRVDADEVFASENLIKKATNDKFWEDKKPEYKQNWDNINKIKEMFKGWKKLFKGNKPGEYVGYYTDLENKVNDLLTDKDVMRDIFSGGFKFSSTYNISNEMLDTLNSKFKDKFTSIDDMYKAYKTPETLETPKNYKLPDKNYNDMQAEFESFKELMYGGLTQKERKALGQVFTPPNIVKMMLEKYDAVSADGKQAFGPGQSMLDPTSGAGNLIMGAIFAGNDVNRVYGNELSPLLVRKARRRIHDYLEAHPEYKNGNEFNNAQIHVGNALLRSSLLNYDVPEDEDYVNGSSTYYDTLKEEIDRLKTEKSDEGKQFRDWVKKGSIDPDQLLKDVKEDMDAGYPMSDDAEYYAKPEIPEKKKKKKETK